MSSMNREEELTDILRKVEWGQLDSAVSFDRILRLFSVKRQREQLISFFNWYQDDPKEFSNNETIVDAYLDDTTEPKHDAKMPVIESACKKEKCKHWNGLFNRCKFVNADCCQAVL